MRLDFDFLEVFLPFVLEGTAVCWVSAVVVWTSEVIGSGVTG
jgi:hypothetical protein